MFYFLTKRRPPRGCLYQYSHKLKLPPERLAALQVLTEDELKQQLAAGGFWSAATRNDDSVADFNRDNTFQDKVKVHDCPVYWGWKPAASAEK